MEIDIDPPPNGEGATGSTSSIISDALRTLQDDDYWENNSQMLETRNKLTEKPLRSNLSHKVLQTQKYPNNSNSNNQNTVKNSDNISNTKISENTQLNTVHTSQQENNSKQKMLETNNATQHIDAAVPNLQDKNNSLTRKKVFYCQADAGPFVVYIEKNSPAASNNISAEEINTNKTQNIGNLHPMSIGKMIFEKHIGMQQCIKNISSVGKNKIKIECIDPNTANVLLKSKYFADNDYEVYIPQYLARRRGVVRGVPLDFTVEFLKDKIEFPRQIFNFPGDKNNTNFEILDIQRLQRRVFNEQTKTASYKDTQSLIISFKGQKLPNYVKIFGVNCLVEPFIQKVLQCRNCLRFGHTAKACNGKTRCDRCGENHSKNECNSENPPVCLHCKGDHFTSEITKCKEFARQKTIKLLMGNENLSFKDASKLCDEKSFSGILSLNHNDKPNPMVVPDLTEFPSLPKKTNKNSDEILLLPLKKSLRTVHKPVFEEEIINKIPTYPRNVAYYPTSKKRKVADIDKDAKEIIELCIFILKDLFTQNKLHQYTQSEIMSLVLNKINASEAPNNNNNGSKNFTMERQIGYC